MADTLTTVWNFVKQTIGGNRNTWGGINNANFDLVEAGLAGILSKAVTGGSVTLTTTERRNRILSFTGTLASNQAVVIANVSGVWLVYNGTSGAFSLSFKTSSGAAVTLTQGSNGILWCDGNDTMRLVSANDLGISNVTFAMLASATIASQGNAQAMTAADKLMTPQRTWDAIWAFKANFITVLDKDTLTAPGGPSEGDRYFVNGTGAGGWTGGSFDNKIAEYRGAAWVAFTPTTDQIIMVADEDRLYRWTGSALAWYFPQLPVLAPSQIGANQNDYAPTGIGAASVLLLNSDADRNITGITTGAMGRVLGIVNNGSFHLTLKDASGSSTAANRFAFGGDVVINAGRSAILVYDDANSRWKLLLAPAPTAFGNVPFGQCQLIKSGSNLLLKPFNGNLLTINGVPEVIPDAGVSLGAGGSAGTLGYIYAFMSAGAMALETSATAYAIQAGTGMPIKSGDATRTLVGMAYPTTGPAWIDSATQRFVRSWFNDPGISLSNVLTAARTVSSTSFAEVNSEIRIEFIIWTGEVFSWATSGRSTPGSSVNIDVSVGFNGTTAEDAFVGAFTGGVNQRSAFGLSGFKAGLTEGYNYCTLLGKVDGSSTAFAGSSTAGTRCTLRGYAKR